MKYLTLSLLIIYGVYYLAMPIIFSPRYIVEFPRDNSLLLKSWEAMYERYKLETDKDDDFAYSDSTDYPYHRVHYAWIDENFVIVWAGITSFDDSWLFFVARNFYTFYVFDRTKNKMAGKYTLFTPITNTMIENGKILHYNDRLLFSDRIIIVDLENVIDL